jgi:tetratricopeptide (TPR) repeat protein
MKNRLKMLGLASTLLAGAWLAGCQNQITFLKARDHLNKGVRAFTASDFVLAAEHFQQSIELDPELLAARQYLATAYRQQYVPGAESEDNAKIAGKAIESFQEVLRRDPNNEMAMLSIASLYFDMKEMDKAKEWNQKVIQSYPNNKTPYYTVGVINWTETYQPRLEVRANLGMKPEDPGPIKDAKARQELAVKNMPLVDQGLEMLQKSVELDPDYADAMAYINLMYREKADLADSADEYEKLSSIADEWVQKTLDTKKRLAEAGTQDQFAQ